MAGRISPLKKTLKWSFPGDAWILSFAFTALYMGILYMTGKMTIIFDTAAVEAISSGDMIGYPNAHLLFENYLLGLILSGLYTVLPTINWHSAMLLFSIAFSLWAILFFEFSQAGNYRVLKQFISGGITVLFFHWFFFEDIMSIYFHNCALIAGVAAFYCFLLSDELKLKDFLILLILGALCAGIRFSVFKELVPFFAIGVMIRLFVFHKKENLIRLICGIMAITGLMYIINANAYTGIFSHEREINSYRSALQDYNGLPEYENHEELYESVGMNFEETEIMRACWGLSDYFNKETLSAILAGVKTDINVKKDQIRRLVTQLFEKDYPKTFWLLEGVLAVAVFLVAFRRRSRWMLACYAFILLTVAGEIIYLAYNGRMPVRTTKGPLLIFLLSGIAYMIYNRAAVYRRLNRNVWTRTVAVVLVLTCLFGTATASRDAYLHFEQINNYRTEKELRLVEYMRSHPENLYFLYTWHEKLSLIRPERRNYAGWAGWVSETADWRILLQGEHENVWDAIAGRRELRFMILDTAIEAMQRYMQKRGYEITAAFETVDVDGQGTEYKVWKFLPLAVDDA